MGLKLLGEEGSDKAPCLAISLTAAFFHCDGIDFIDRQELKRSRRASLIEGHFLRTQCGIWSKGEGTDVELALLITSFNSF